MLMQASSIYVQNLIVQNPSGSFFFGKQADIIMQVRLASNNDFLFPILICVKIPPSTNE